MKNSLLILLCFLMGVVGSAGGVLPPFFHEPDLATFILFLLLFLVGIGIGSNPQTRRLLRQARLRVLLVPLTIVLGTLLGAGACSLLLADVGGREALAVGAGFGYYSLSSIMITELYGQQLGVVALLANILREILTLLLTPILARYCGKLAPIASGGATAMDTTLPIISRFLSQEYALVALFSGVVLTVAVPVLVTLILTL